MFKIIRFVESISYQNRRLYKEMFLELIRENRGDIMLVLGRKPGEYVMIGHNIKVEVVKSEKGDLRLAIDAPKDITIVRGEILEKLDSQTDTRD